MGQTNLLSKSRERDAEREALQLCTERETEAQSWPEPRTGSRRPCPWVQQQRSGAVRKAAGRETLLCFLKLSVGLRTPNPL